MLTASPAVLLTFSLLIRSERLKRRLLNKFVRSFSARIRITRPARLEILSTWESDTGSEENGKRWESEIRLTIHEGKFHQVKRMMEALGKKVTYLKRLSMGPLALPADLPTGKYRPLTEKELELLKSAGNR